MEFKNVFHLLKFRQAYAKILSNVVCFQEKQKETFEVRSNSALFCRCLEQAKAVSATAATVLLLGETGVGKEVMARYMHQNSGCSGPFVAVHPASVSTYLFETEFFGHEKGTFTGAAKQKIGFFELADKGTLFIDELGEVPVDMQIKLLRVLQEHCFMRVWGGTKEIHSSFRLILPLPTAIC